MRNQLRSSIVAVAASVLFVAAIPGVGQVPDQRRAARIGGKPNLTGLWQAFGTAYWDIEDHDAKAGPFMGQLGAIGAIPAGQGIVEGSEIPYLPEAAAKKKENFANRLSLDPEARCYMPGVPRATYMPFPFQIIQSPDHILMAYEYGSANRIINIAKRKEAVVDTWMGTSNGRWEGETLVVDVTGLNGQSWFDRVGNFASENVHIVERYTLAGADHINYEATIEDKTVFSRPWKISLPLYRRKEKNAQLLDFKCVEFAEELLYGHLRKKQE